MSNKSGSSSQVISLPQGGGAQKGLGEKFSPDLHTGTGNFTIPIALPPGRNGFQPQLSLVYSTGNGNGLFGLGWNLSVPGVTRKTSKGIPRYRDYDNVLKERDTFILSGAEDLVPLDDEKLDSGKATHYRPRTEGLFAKIIHHHDAQTKTNHWEVSSKDGLKSFYGTPPPDPQSPAWNDPSVIRKPKVLQSDPDRIFAWKLTLTKDPFGNRIEYLYDERDQSSTQDRIDGHDWDQPLLKQIRYADYQEGNATKFLVTVTFLYEDRRDPLDPFSDYRAGFEIRTTKRCKEILIHTHADQIRNVRRYEFEYANDSLNRVSQLTTIEVVGFDDGGTEFRELPPLEFGYTNFNPQDQKRRDFYPVQGADLPATSLANSSMELVDLFGNGLPDVLEMNGSVRYWRNRGNGQFDLPRPMSQAPAGVALSSAGVQLIDANGDGRTDLLVTQGALSGYYPLKFGGLWDRRSFQKYQYAPSFDLKDPEVRLMDLTGDGVTDVLRSGTRLECFFNDPHEGWLAHNTRWVERQGIEDFRNVNFSDSRIKLGDMTADGMQDIVLVCNGNVEYWPNLGYGNWGKRLHMENSPRFPYGYDPKRILVGDVDGDGLADIVYVDDRKVTLWINQSGNRWSDPIEILGTPPVSDMDGVRLVDLLGSGISGVLWTRDAALDRRAHYFFLDLTGGTKPYLLHEMNNHMGALTKVGYAPSTRYYLDDQEQPTTRWKTTLPFPVQVVSHVEVIDEISKGKLTTTYKYHHGYWDGAEREFRGFGMVEQFDTEVIAEYNTSGLHGVAATFENVETYFSPPTLTKSWFHQGPIGEEFGDWQEQDWSSQYWQGNNDPQILKHTEPINTFLQGLTDRRVQRDALRTLRGSILRTELYALDDTGRAANPYTVTEYAYGLREEFPPAPGEKDRLHIFFAHGISQCTTQWERGIDPLTQFSFTSDFDDVGQPLQQTQIACPRGWRKLDDRSPDKPYLATRSRTVFAIPLDPDIYIRDRVARTTTYEIENNGSQTIDELRNLPDSDPAIIGQSLNFYDGDESADRAAFVGLPYGQVGKFGALVRTESLVLTDDILQTAYGTDKPAYLAHSGPVNWTADYPQGFQTALPPLAGYSYQAGGAGSEYTAGYFVNAERRRYDFHAATDGRGLVVAKRDPLGRDTTVRYDDYNLLPIEVIDAVGLQMNAEYSYRVLQPREVTDPNGNRSRINFTPLGLPKDTFILGKTVSEGDQQRPSITLEYDFLAFTKRGEPVYVRTLRQLYHDSETDVPLPQRDETIEIREYSDGFGRLLQTRTQAEDLVFADIAFQPNVDLIFGNTILPFAQPDPGERVVGYPVADPMTKPRVTVSGWQVYDNKGRVVEKYEPFFSEGWSYTPPTADQLGQKARMFYDPRGQVIRTLNPDGSEQRVIYGVPRTLADPTNLGEITPTPWEAYTYDTNDNAGRTHAHDSVDYRHHWNTPSNILIDALGRAIVAVERNRAKPASSTSALPPIEEVRISSTYDIQGNLLTITDALNRVAFSHVYDLAKRPLRIDSIDAGTRITVSDAIGNEIERRDSKGVYAKARRGEITGFTGIDDPYDRRRRSTAFDASWTSCSVRSPSPLAASIS
jgi:YD repeat-containing protein